MTRPVPIANASNAEVMPLMMPANSTAGTMSTSRPRRKATVNPAKPSAAPSAARSPNKSLSAIPSPIITATPANAPSIASHVARLTISPSTSHPSKAAAKGAALNRNRVLATVEWVMEKTNPTKAQARQQPASTPVQPTACSVADDRPG